MKLTTDQAMVEQVTHHPRQWGLGRFFYYREGEKNRLKTRMALYCTLGLFFVVLLVGLFKDTETDVLGIRSSIGIPTGVSQNQSINVPPAVAETQSQAHETRPSTAHSRSPNDTRFSRLQAFDRRTTLKIPPGAMARAKLVSGASDGPVRAELVENLVIGGENLLERGTSLIGKGNSTEERLSVGFTHAVFKDGNSIRIEAVGCDLTDKMPGLKGSNVRGQALKLSGALGLGFLGGTAAGLQKRQDPQGANAGQPSMRDAVLNGLMVASMEQARNLASDLNNTKPLYEVPEQTLIYIMFSGDGS
jgi:hypothetical protein